jgi:hypothetical protein
MTEPDPDIIMADASAPRVSPWSHSSRQPRLPSELPKQRVVLRHKGQVYTHALKQHTSITSQVSINGPRTSSITFGTQKT